MKTKKVCELNKGDSFIYLGMEYIVTSVSEGRVFYKRRLKSDSPYRISFGSNSKMKVEVLEFSTIIYER